MRTIIFLISSLVCFSIYPQTNKINANRLDGFRGIPWGVSKDSVRNKESAEYLQSFKGFGIESFSYKGSIAGLDCRIDYTFRNDRLAEGMYSFETPKSVKPDFLLLYEYLAKSYGKPQYMAGPSINDAEIWIKKNNYGKFQGPELYWSFKNGFAALQASRFKDDIGINIIFIAGKTIEEYGSENIVPAENFIH